MSTSPIITFLGGGNMAEAIFSGLLEQGTAPEAIRVSEPLDERRDFLSTTYGILVFADSVEAVTGADVVVLAVKPQIIAEALRVVAPALPPKALVISIAAGLTAATLEAQLPANTPLVRVMPNTPSLVKQGMSGLSSGTHATTAHMDLASSLLSSVGQVVEVEEPMLDVVTALSGSGPAYVFYLIESMLRGGEALGADPQLARQLVLQTVSGAAALMADTGLDADELRRRVTSKGGTTAAAIATFDANGVGDGIAAGVQAAHARSLEISRGT